MSKEGVDSFDNSVASYGGDNGISPEQQQAVKRAVRKIDLAVVPVMTMYYFLSFLDRANIGNARVAGLQADLGFTDHQYQVVVTVLFVPYICAELPSNLLLRTLGPRIVMPTLLTLWGILVMVQGFISTYEGLIAVRAFLGLLEGPMFPGIVLYLSSFYTRNELSIRVAMFFSSASLSGAFSGLLAAAIQQMEGVGGKRGWQWIFILEGLFSVLVGLVGFFVTPSTPRDVKLLSEKEKDLVMARLEADRPSINPADKFSFKYVLQSLTSVHVILTFCIFFMMGTTLYGIALFLPSIVKQFGYGPNKTQLLSAGPFGAGFVVTLLAAYLSDRYKSRAAAAIGLGILSTIGYALFLTQTDKKVLYASFFFMVSGVYASAPPVSAWMANNSEPYYTRATSVALGFVATNAGGITCTWLYPSSEGPRWTRTTKINLAFCITPVFLAIINALILARKNKIKKEKRLELLAPYSTEGEPDGGLRAWMELGDKHPDFKYTL
jgi:MFS family permease